MATKTRKKATSTSKAIPQMRTLVDELISKHGISMTDRAAYFLNNYVFRSNTRVRETARGIEISTLENGQGSELCIHYNGEFDGSISLFGAC